MKLRALSRLALSAKRMRKNTQQSTSHTQPHDQQSSPTSLAHSIRIAANPAMKLRAISRLTLSAKRLRKNAQQSTSNNVTEKERLRVFLDGCKLGLTVVRESADACPPLKSVVGGIVKIMDLIETVGDNDEEAQRLLQRAANLYEAIEKTVPIESAEETSNQLLASLVQLDQSVGHVEGELSHITTNRPWMNRFVNQRKYHQNLRVLDNQLHEAQQLFLATATLRIEIGQLELLGEVKYVKEAVVAVGHSIAKIEAAEIGKSSFTVFF